MVDLFLKNSFKSMHNLNKDYSGKVLNEPDSSQHSSLFNQKVNLTHKSHKEESCFSRNLSSTEISCVAAKNGKGNLVHKEDVTYNGNGEVKSLGKKDMNCDVPILSSNVGLSSDQYLSPGACVPIGIFWDIENVRFSSNKSAVGVVEQIRRRFLTKFREAEFLVVCDVRKEKKELLTDLNNAQVTVVHVYCTSKNAADDKLRQCMRRFVDNVGSPCAVMLISSDVNFSPDLGDFKNRKNIHVIVLHRPEVSNALLICSNEHYLFDEITKKVPFNIDIPLETQKNGVYLNITNLPLDIPRSVVIQRVEHIANNCGGKMVKLIGNRGIIRFTSNILAERALLRMEGENVFGKKISVSASNRSSVASHIDVQSKSNDGNKEMDPTGIACNIRSVTPFPPPPNFDKVTPPSLLNLNLRPHCNDEQKETAIGCDEPLTEMCERSNVDDTFHCAVVEADGPNRWDYSQTPSEYLIDKTPQGHRRMCGNQKDQHQMSSSVNSQETKTANVAATPFLAVIPESVKPSSENKPIFASKPAQTSSSPAIDLHVTNLDQSIGADEMTNLLTSVFKQHVRVINVTVHIQSDGHFSAIVRVPAIQDAQYCVSKLHQRKLGSKRITIAYDQSSYGSGFGRIDLIPFQIRTQVNVLRDGICQSGNTSRTRSDYCDPQPKSFIKQI